MIGTLIALGCIFAAIALVLGLIFMPRTAALLFGLQIALPYFVILAKLMGKYASFLSIVGLTFLLFFSFNLVNEVIAIKDKYFSKK